MAREWSYYDIINRRYPGGVVPKEKDFVTNMQTGDEYYISAIDNFGVVTLKSLTNHLNDSTDEYRSTSHISPLTHRPDIYIDRSKTMKAQVNEREIVLGHMIYFSDSVVTGRNTDYYRLFKSKDISTTPISCNPTIISGSVRDYASAVTVETNEGSFKAPGDMLINRHLSDGEEATLVAYDNENNPISIIPLKVGTTLCHTRLTGGIVGIEVVSPFKSNGDLNLIDLSDREIPQDLSDFTIKVQYEDETHELHPINGNTVRIDGLMDFLANPVTNKSFITATYKNTTNGRCRIIRRDYEVRKNSHIVIEAPELPPVPSGTGWIELGYYSYFDISEGWIQFEEAQYNQPWDNERFSSEVFPSDDASGTTALIPYGGWEVGVKPSVIKVVITDDGSRAFGYNFTLMTKGGTLIPTWRHPVFPEDDEALEDNQYALYLIAMRYPKSPYANDPRDELGSLRFSRSDYVSYEMKISSIDVISVWPSVLNDYRELGVLYSDMIRDGRGDFQGGWGPQAGSSLTFTAWMDKFQKETFYNIPDEYVYLNSDRLYTDSRTDAVADYPLVRLDDTQANIGIEQDLAGISYVGEVYHGSKGIYQPIIDLYGSFPINPHSYVPREVTTEARGESLSGKNFIAHVSVGRMDRGSGVSDGPSPSWYVGIDDWFKVTIDDTGLLSFSDTRSGISYTQTVDITPVTGDLYDSETNGPIEWFGTSASLEQVEEPFFNIRMHEVIFVYSDQSGTGVLFINGAEVSRWTNYPANFPEVPSRLVYNRGSADRPVNVGHIKITESSYLANHFITNGLSYNTIFDKMKEAILGYSFAGNISRIFTDGEWIPEKLIENPDMSNPLPFYTYGRCSDFWAASYIMDTLNLIPHDAHRSVSIKHINALVTEYTSNTFIKTRVRRLNSWTLHGDQNHGYSWRFSSAMGGDVYHWHGLDRFSSQQLQGVRDFMTAYSSDLLSDPYPTIL